jgi:hypothetical protein
VRRYTVEGLKFCLRWWMLSARRIGRRRRATQTGRGMRIVSTKQDVGMGEEIVECGPCLLVSSSDHHFTEKVTHEALNAVGTKLRHLCQ